MGGFTIEKLPDGRENGTRAPWGAPKGLSALDLYSMGMIGPDEVPDSFFISGAVPDGKGGLTGGDKIPVRIADVIAVNGPQNPPAREARHHFKFQIYLIYEDGREPDPRSSPKRATLR